MNIVNNHYYCCFENKVRINGYGFKGYDSFHIYGKNVRWPNINFELKLGLRIYDYDQMLI